MFQREDKYLVLKYDDIMNYLTEDAANTLISIASIVSKARQIDGKKHTNFVCVKDTMNIYEEVWKMVEEEVNERSIKDACTSKTIS